MWGLVVNPVFLFFCFLHQIENSFCSLVYCTGLSNTSFVHKGVDIQHTCRAFFTNKALYQFQQVTRTHKKSYLIVF